MSVSSLSGRTQNASNATPEKPDFSKEAAVAELLSVKASFENEGTSALELTLRARIQSDAGVKQYGLQTFTYQGATQSIEIEYVRVRKPDGTVIVTPLDNIQDLDAGITREAPFYSDLREKHVAIKALSPGDMLEYQVRWHTTKPLAPGQFWYNYDFEHAAVVLDEELEISVPRDRPVKLRSPDYMWTSAETKDRRVYSWKASNLKNHTEENRASRELDAGLGRLAPSDVQLSSFQSWQEVGQWYWQLQQERIQPTAEIRAKYSELTKGSTDSAASVRSLYDFVSTKFRYIGVAFGIGRYQPHLAEDVLSNQFGDCKDKHTLLASLLAAGGISAYPALISSSHRIDPDVPSPAQFDHVITAIPQGSSYQWLDTTTEVGPFGYLVPTLRDKQALVMPGAKSATLVTTPKDLPFQAVQKLTVDGKLTDDGTLDAKMHYYARGDYEVLLRAGFRQVAQPQWKDLVQQISYGMGFAGAVSDVAASSPDGTDSEFEFSYSYNRKDYPDWSDHQITMPGLRLGLPEVKDDEVSGKQPIWLGTPVQLISDVKVGLPSGYTPQLPDDVVVIRDYAEYHSTYRQEGNAIIAHRELLAKMVQAPDASREDYKKFVKNVSDDVNGYVVLSSALTPAAPVLRSPEMLSVAAAVRNLPDSNNPEAQELERTAYGSNGADQAGALDAFKRAVAVDPKFTRGWIILGELEMALHQVDAGVSAFRSAVDSDPKQPVSYQMLASVLLSLHRTDEAIETWQALLKALPGDAGGIRHLGELLYANKRYVDALPLLQTDVKLNPGALTKSWLGIAYLKTGQVELGLTTLHEAMKMDSSPLVLNNVAFELADANLELSEALDDAQKAVQAEEEASEKIHLADLTIENLRLANVIASFWDTLGWVQFRLGHPDESEKYLRAAWTLSQSGVVGDHLGQLYESRQQHAEAIRMYRLALRTASLTPGNDQDQIKAHLAQLDPKSGTSSDFDAGTELSALRSVKLARFYQGSATADYFLLFSAGGKLEEVKFVKGSEKLDAAEKALRAANFQLSFPNGSKARIVRRGIVSCSKYTGCSIVFLTPDMVTSVD